MLSEGDFPGHMKPWESIQEMQQLLRELGMRQAIYAPLFESLDQAAFTAGMKAKILQSAPPLISVLSPAMGQGIFDVGQPVADLA